MLYCNILFYCVCFLLLLYSLPYHVQLTLKRFKIQNLKLSVVSSCMSLFNISYDMFQPMWPSSGALKFLHFCTLCIMYVGCSLFGLQKTKTKLHGLSPQANYTDRLSDRRLSAKLVQTLADSWCRVISATVPAQPLISVF
jgi:hypothetical protein